MTGEQRVEELRPAAPPRPLNAGPRSAGQIVRRLVVYSLLAVLVGVAATGVAGLLGLLLDRDTLLAGDNTSSVAQYLAFTLIGGPLAALLWWSVWRRLAEPAERGSLAWGLYLSAVLIVSLIVFSSALLEVMSELIDGDWNGPRCAIAAVWAAVWVWHDQSWRNRSKSPSRLATVPAVLGASFGLILGAGSAIATLAIVFDAALVRLVGTALVEGAWVIGALQSLIWALGGAAVWAWHWYRAGARTSSTAFAQVALVVLGILGATVATLGGLGMTLFVLLRLAVDRTDPLTSILAPLPVALASAVIGGAIWIYARAATRTRPAATAEAAVLATSGVSLAGAASGIGVIINSALALLATPLAGDDTRTLLLGGLSALLVGAPVWWFAWRPYGRADASRQSTGRRVYLIAIFGISAVVALITLLVIGFRLFEFVLGGSEGLIERVRAPLGLLTATALVAGYHFSVWRSDRADVDADADAAQQAPPERQRHISEVILVTGANSAPLVRALEQATGASVTVWPTQGTAVAGVEPAAVVGALDGVTGSRVLVVATDHIDVVPLAD
ncbi:DUF5671 domain-containing protein [Mycetocola zhadangensis]|uniref:DUF5671 domain-containing protein n=1 Tax=Mycetocola zhadangensis TaxID=1164595 RepID=UPI003A4D44C0